MSMQAIHIERLPIKLLLGLIVVVSTTGCLILSFLPISYLIKLVIIALILVSSAFFILRDALLLLPSSWKSIDVDSKGQLTMTNKSGQQFELKLAASSFIHAACSVINFKREGLSFALPAVILLANASNAEEFRRLRVWLRWFKHEKNQDDLVIADLIE